MMHVEQSKLTVWLSVQSFGVGTAAVGMTMSTYALARLMMNLPAGILADRHGRKILLVWGPALTALGTACQATYWAACLSRDQRLCWSCVMHATWYSRCTLDQC